MSASASVKWFNDARGFGFLVGEDGRDIFVHYSVIEMDGFRTLKPGERVAFELVEGARGLFARHVRRIDSPTAAEPMDRTIQPAAC